MTEHSILSPSSAARWVQCPGSVSMSLLFPEAGPREEAAEGEAAHWIGALKLSGKWVDPNGEPENITAPNGVVINSEMIEAATLYVDAVEKAVEAALQHSMIHIEKRVDCSILHRDCFGTPDAWFYDATGLHLHIFDFKYGHGFVEAFDNWQLITYAAGVLNQLGIDGIKDQFVNVSLTIVQPRSYHKNGPVRTWTVKASDLRPYFNNLAYRAEAALLPNPVTHVGAECRYCPARHACTTVQNAALNVVDMAGLSVPVDLPPAALGQELRTLHRSAELLKARITGLEEQAEATIKRGQNIPHFKLESSSGREVWQKPAAEIIAMGQMMQIDLARQPDAITPKQAIKAGIPAEVVRMYSHTPSGGLKLAPDDGRAAKNAFSK